MSDLAATNCGCSGGCGGNSCGNNLLFLLLILPPAAAAERRWLRMRQRRTVRLQWLRWTVKL
ncbi:MAG: hypothetical protein V8S96_06800 [Lachnospiraceae bacterium]